MEDFDLWFSQFKFYNSTSKYWAEKFARLAWEYLKDSKNE